MTDEPAKPAEPTEPAPDPNVITTKTWGGETQSPVKEDEAERPAR